MKKLFCLCLSALLILSFAAGCKQAIKVNAEDVRKYSDEAAENILTAANKKDYEKFSKDFSLEMRKAISKEAFDKLIEDFDKKIGNYVSHKFSSVSAKDNYIISIYKARFTKESADVILRVVFEEKDEKMQISGLYYDSSNLRKK